MKKNPSWIFNWVMNMSLATDMKPEPETKSNQIKRTVKA